MRFSMTSAGQPFGQRAVLKGRCCIKNRTPSLRTALGATQRGEEQVHEELRGVVQRVEEGRPACPALPHPARQLPHSGGGGGGLPGVRHGRLPLEPDDAPQDCPAAVRRRGWSSPRVNVRRRKCNVSTSNEAVRAGSGPNRCRSWGTNGTFLDRQKNFLAGS